MVDTAFLSDQIRKAMERVTDPVETILKKAEVSKSTFYKSILGKEGERTDRTNVSVAVRLAEAMGYGYKRESDKFYFVKPENAADMDEKNREALKMLQSLKPETREIFLIMLRKLVDSDSK